MKYSEQNLLTIITVTHNNDNELLETLESIYTQTSQPSKIIIKDGVRREQPLFIKDNKKDIIFLSGHDSGIYDAMNISLEIVETPYILFLNSGDLFLNNNSLKYFYEEFFLYLKKNNTIPDAIFFKWTQKNRKIIFSPNKKPLRFNHQAVIYKKSLHDEIGKYISQNKFIVADYLFFKILLSLKEKKIVFSDQLMSMIDPNGLSSSLRNFLSVKSIDYLFGEVKRESLIVIAIFHPFYNFIKKILKVLVKI